MRNIFGVIKALLANFKCKCQKIAHFQTFKPFAKIKKLIFLPISIILRLIPIKFETLLKPPILHPLTHRVHSVAMATFWRTFQRDGKISPDW
jgi:hypothetical protein